MKKLQQITALAFLVIFLMAGCKKRDLEPNIGSLNVTIQVKYDKSGQYFNLPMEDVEVRMENLWTGRENKAVANNNGLVEFNGASAGNYNIEAIVTIPRDLFNNLTGQSRDEDVVLSGQLLNHTVNNQLNAPLELEIHVGRQGDLLIKQIYYAGSSTSNGASFRDQFLEIYNNSNDTIYADSLYVAQVMGVNSANPDLSSGYYLTSGSMVGQYDWSKSIGMVDGSNANDDYIYAKSLYRIPGSGSTYPVAPGESIVLAQTAVNQQAPYSNNTGGTIAIKDPSLTIDLSQADFEVFLGPYLAIPLVSDIDNPAVPDLEMLLYTGKEWILDNLGRDGYAIFKTSEDVENEFKKYPNPTIKSVTSTTALNYQIPAGLIIDAVEVQPTTAASRVAKRVLGKLDAGFTFVPGGSFSSESVIRKTAKTINGRKILMDTNNSTQDFDYFTKANPKAFY